MSIKLGTQNIVGLYKGNTEIIKRYKGNNLVYESFLPYSFEYLYNSYIPTAINNKPINDKLKLIKIYANAVIENQLCQDNFDTTGYWARNRLTMSINNHIATFVSNSNAYNQVSFYHSFPAGQLVKGNKYLVSIKVRLTSGLCSDFRLYMQNDSTILQNPQLNVWYNLRFIWTNTRENTQTVNGIVTQRTYNSVDDIVIDSDSFEAKEPQLIDLTLREGPGNEPTSLTDNRIQSLLNQRYIEYNTGTYKGTDIGEFVSEPYNLCDGIFQIRPNDALKRCIESKIIPAIAGQTYVFEKPTFEDYQYRHFQVLDENGVFIREELKAKATEGAIEITLNANERYLRVQYWYYEANHYTNAPSQETLNTCVHIAGSRTGYAPHTQPYTLPFIYQGNSALNAHDTLEITNTEYVFTKNVSKVDLGTLPWTPYTGLGDTKLYWATISDIKLSSNLLCSSLTQVPAVYNTGNDNSISSHPSWSRVYARTTNAQATASEFKTAMSGVMLYYELATPQVTRIPRKHLAVVDLGSLSGYVSNDKYFISSEYLGINTMSSNDNGYACYCKDYLIDSGYNVYNKTKDKTMCLTSPFIGNNFIIWDSSFIGKTAEEIKALLSGTYLFYETQDEVADIDFEIGVEAGGTLTSNWFSWVENQLVNYSYGRTITTNGITITNNNDGSFTISGTATAYSDIWFVLDNTQKMYSSHKYLLFSGIVGSNTTGSRLGIRSDAHSTSNMDIGYGAIGSPSSDTTRVIVLFTCDNGVSINQTVKPSLVDITIGFGTGKEPTSINDPRIQYIIEHGHLPTNTAGTNKSIASGVLPNIDVSFNRK